jgi:hypothetical protein
LDNVDALGKHILDKRRKLGGATEEMNEKKCVLRIGTTFWRVFFQNLRK